MTQLAVSSLFALALLLFWAPAIAASEREEPGARPSRRPSPWTRSSSAMSRLMAARVRRETDRLSGRYFIDAKSFLLLRRDETYERDGKKVQDSYRFGDYRAVAGRMFNHRFEWATDGVVGRKSIVSNIGRDQPIDAAAYAMQK